VDLLHGSSCASCPYYQSVPESVFDSKVLEHRLGQLIGGLDSASFVFSGGPNASSFSSILVSTCY
jgi:hypothetical protein